MKTRSKWYAARHLAMAFLALALGRNAHAMCTLGSGQPAINFGVIETTFPADDTPGFVPVAPWMELEWLVADCPGDASDNLFVEVEAFQNRLGEYSEGGTTYAVLNAGGNSLGFIVEFSRSDSSPAIPVTSSPSQFKLEALRGPNHLKVRTRLGFYGRKSAPTSKVNTILLQVTRAGSRASIPFYLKAQVDVLKKTCAVTSGPALDVTIPPVNASRFDGPGSTVDGKDFSLSLHCDAATRVFATLTDATRPDNRSTTLTLSPGSDPRARGVGYQIVGDGLVPVSFGPDSAEPGAENQFAVGDILTGGGNIELPLKVRYLQTELEIIPGSADATATITFSYQ